MKISFVWPLEIRFEGGRFNPPNAKEMCHALSGEWWAGKTTPKAEFGNGRHELSLEVPYFGGALYYIQAAKRFFTRSFGINPDIEVNGVQIEVFAWRENAGKIYRQGLIDNAITTLRHGHPDSQKAAARVAFARGLVLTDVEIVAKVDAEARQETR